MDLAVLIDACDRCLVALDYLYRLRLFYLYLGSSTCCMERQVESPTSLGTIHLLLPCSQKSDFVVELIRTPILFRQVGLVDRLLSPT